MSHWQVVRLPVTLHARGQYFNHVTMSLQCHDVVQCHDIVLVNNNHNCKLAPEFELILVLVEVQSYVSIQCHIIHVSCMTLY